MSHVFFLRHSVLMSTHLSFVGLVYTVGEERSEVRTAGRHDGTVYGEMAVAHSNHGVAQLAVLTQVA